MKSDYFFCFCSSVSDQVIVGSVRVKDSEVEYSPPPLKVGTSACTTSKQEGHFTITGMKSTCTANDNDRRTSITRSALPPRISNRFPVRLKGLQILIVDDSALITKLMKIALEKDGHTVESACNGKIGLHMMMTVENKYDVVLMDIQMPTMGGFEAVARFRQFESKEQEEYQSHVAHGDHNNMKRRRQLIIGASAQDSPEVRIEALSIGMDDFLVKPFDLPTLYKKIAELREDLVAVVVAKEKDASPRSLYTICNNDFFSRPSLSSPGVVAAASDTSTAAAAISSFEIASEGSAVGAGTLPVTSSLSCGNCSSSSKLAENFDTSNRGSLQQQQPAAGASNMNQSQRGTSIIEQPQQKQYQQKQQLSKQQDIQCRPTTAALHHSTPFFHPH